MKFLGVFVVVFLVASRAVDNRLLIVVLFSVAFCFLLLLFLTCGLFVHSSENSSSSYRFAWRLCLWVLFLTAGFGQWEQALFYPLAAKHALEESVCTSFLYLFFSSSRSFPYWISKRCCTLALYHGSRWSGGNRLFISFSMYKSHARSSFSLWSTDSTW